MKQGWQNSNTVRATPTMGWHRPFPLTLCRLNHLYTVYLHLQKAALVGPYGSPGHIPIPCSSASTRPGPRCCSAHRSNTATMNTYPSQCIGFHCKLLEGSSFDLSSVILCCLELLGPKLPFHIIFWSKRLILAGEKNC